MAGPAPYWLARADGNVTRNSAKSIAQLVREATDGGRLLIETLVQIATGPDSTDRDRVSATTVLLDRGFGKAVETSLQLQVDAGSSDALSQLADHELERLAATLSPSASAPVVVLPAAALSPSAESLPDPPVDSLEAPFKLPPPVTQPDVPETTDPVEPLPAPLAKAPRRRIVVPRPVVARPVATVDEPTVVDRSDVEG